MRLEILHPMGWLRLVGSFELWSLFCQRDLWKRRYSAKETCNLRRKWVVKRFEILHHSQSPSSVANLIYHSLRKVGWKRKKYENIHIYTYVYIRMCMYTNMYVCIIHICVYIIYTHIYIYIYMYVYVRVWICIYEYVFKHIHIHIHTYIYMCVCIYSGTSQNAFMGCYGVLLVLHFLQKVVLLYTSMDLLPVNCGCRHSTAPRALPWLCKQSRCNLCTSTLWHLTWVYRRKPLNVACLLSIATDMPTVTVFYWQKAILWSRCFGNKRLFAKIRTKSSEFCKISGFIVISTDNANSATHYVKLGKKRQESSIHYSYGVVSCSRCVRTCVFWCVCMCVCACHSLLFYIRAESQVAHSQRISNTHAQICLER